LLLVFFGLLFRRRQALEALQQFFFGHALDGDLGVVGIDAGTGLANQRNRIRLRLVHLNEFLQGMNEFFTQILGGNRRIGDFAQRYNRVFVVVAVNRQLRSGRNHPCAMRRQKNQVEPVVDLINAIFYGDASHRLSLR
jgi:hypothetical protein